MTGAGDRTPSLQRTALTWMTALLVLVGCVAFIVTYALGRRDASDLLDVQLRQVALNAGLAFAAADAPSAADRDPGDPIAVTIWKHGVVARDDLPEGDPGIPKTMGFADVAMSGGAWRTYTIGNAVWTVRAARRRIASREYARSAALGAAAPILLLIPFASIMVGWAMNRVLGPLGALAHAVAERNTFAAAPLPLAGIPTEVVPLVEAMNGLIVRLQAAVDLQKQFLADAAHELRTPLAAVRIHVGDLGASLPQDWETRKADIDRSVGRASALVGDLLSLARLDASDHVAYDVVDLGALLLDCIGDHVVVAETKGIDLGVVVRSSATVRGTGSELRTLLANLVDNAVRYTPAGGQVDVGLHTVEGVGIVEILDTGCGIPATAETRIFDRFFRAAPACADGSGLGLSIARRIAERHGLILTVANRGDGRSGVCARLVVPA